MLRTVTLDTDFLAAQIFHTECNHTSIPLMYFNDIYELTLTFDVVRHICSGKYTILL